MDIPATIGTIVSWPQYMNLNSDDIYHPFFFCKSSNLMLFISEFSQFFMDKSNRVIKFRDTKVQLMFEN